MNESKPEVRANDCTIGMAGLWLHNGTSKLERHKNSFTFFSSVFHDLRRVVRDLLDRFDVGLVEHVVLAHVV